MKMVVGYLISFACFGLLHVYGTQQACDAPFVQAIGSTDICYTPVPLGKTGTVYCSTLTAPNPVWFYSMYNACFYSISGDGGPEDLSKGCCGAGLPEGRK